MDSSRAKDILDYWFPKTGLPDYGKWFMKSEEYDEEIKEKFGELLKEAEKGKGYGWLVNKDSYIAYIILMDQFSRHIYRGSCEAFKNDNGVLLFTELGWEIYRKELKGYEFMFAFMPFMHTENKTYQQKGLKFFDEHKIMYLAGGERCLANLTDKNSPHFNDFKMLEDMQPHVEGHATTIRCYGRFPKRNNALGRTSTFHEEQYMNREDVKKRPY